MTAEQALLRVARERLRVSCGPSMNGREALWIAHRKSTGSPRGAGRSLKAAIEDMDRLELEEKAGDLLS